MPAGRNVAFPDEIVSRKIQYNPNGQHGANITVPRGVYLVQLAMNPALPATVALFVNGHKPRSSMMKYIYTQRTMTTDLPLVLNVMIRARRRRNVLAVRNIGDNFFILRNLPNTRNNNISLLAQLTVQQLSRGIPPRTHTIPGLAGQEVQEVQEEKGEAKEAAKEVQHENAEEIEVDEESSAPEKPQKKPQEKPQAKPQAKRLIAKAITKKKRPLSSDSNSDSDSDSYSDHSHYSY